VASHGTLQINGGPLDITGANYGNGTLTEWWPCNGGDSQQWQVTGGELGARTCPRAPAQAGHVTATHRLSPRFRPDCRTAHRESLPSCFLAGAASPGLGKSR
jgi:hypothetical protein